MKWLSPISEEMLVIKIASGLRHVSNQDLLFLSQLSPDCFEDAMFVRRAAENEIIRRRLFPARQSVSTKVAA